MARPSAMTRLHGWTTDQTPDGYAQSLDRVSPHAVPRMAARQRRGRSRLLRPRSGLVASDPYRYPAGLQKNFGLSFIRYNESSGTKHRRAVVWR